MNGNGSETGPNNYPDGLDPRAWLDWYVKMGVMDLVGEQPIDQFNKPETAEQSSSERLSFNHDRAQGGRLAPPGGGSTSGLTDREEGPPAWVLGDQGGSGGSPAVTQQQALLSGSDATADARAVAASCDNLEALAEALKSFEGCPLKETAINLCFADGNPKADIMLIGEAPGAQEDRQGKPFVGPSGQLLDRMLGTIGLDRTKVYITNVIYWRPPGNRTPTAAEIAVCQPFLERQIELIRPKFLVFVGGIAARALLGRSEGVTKLRGRPFVYESPEDGREIPALVMFHPAYLLRQPAQKRFSWRDLLEVQAKIKNI